MVVEGGWPVEEVVEGGWPVEWRGAVVGGKSSGGDYSDWSQNLLAMIIVSIGELCQYIT